MNSKLDVLRLVTILSYVCIEKRMTIPTLTLHDLIEYTETYVLPFDNTTSWILGFCEYIISEEYIKRRDV